METNLQRYPFFHAHIFLKTVPSRTKTAQHNHKKTVKTIQRINITINKLGE